VWVGWENLLLLSLFCQRHFNPHLVRLRRLSCLGRASEGVVFVRRASSISSSAASLIRFMELSCSVRAAC
jgi:hypothetical protein